MQQESKMIYGPKVDRTIFDRSLGEHFFDRLQQRSPQDVLYIDALTKESINCRRFLEKTVRLIPVLVKLSLKPGDVVSIICDNFLEYFIVVVACLFEGLTINPLNPDYSIGELKHAVLLSKPKAIFCAKRVLNTVKKLKKELNDNKASVLVIEGLEGHFKSFEDEEIKTNYEDYRPKRIYDLKQTAFIMLSSGTTGLPKGVCLTHENLRTAITYFSDKTCFNLKIEDIGIQFVPTFHIYGILLQASAMVAQIKIIIMSRFEPALFLQCIEEHKVNRLFLVPQIVQFLAKVDLPSTDCLNSLRTIFCGTAPLSKEVLKTLKKRFDFIDVYQNYGLTETTGPCVFQEQTDPYEMRFNVGTFAPGVVAKVVSKNGTHLGPFEAGELCFKGPMLMKTYINTSKDVCFDDENFYHTGDLCFYNDANEVHIIGRLKEIIKYKGFQVAPAELEALLLTHPSVEDCGVVGVADARAGEVPLAFVVIKMDALVSKQEIVDFVAARISIQKRLYGGVRFIKFIPKTTSGKIIRRKLLELYEHRAEN